MKRVLPILIAILIAGGALYWLACGEQEVENQLLISGNIEMTEVDIAFKTPGKLAELLVGEGDTVQAGQVVARLEKTQLLKQRERALAGISSAGARLAQTHAAIAFQNATVTGSIEQRRAEMQAAQSLLDELKNGSREQEVEQAKAAMKQAEAVANNAGSNLERGKTLIAHDDISAQDFDHIKTRAETAAAVLKQAREHYALVLEGPRQEDIASAEAQLRRAKAALQTAEAGHLDIARLRKELEARQADVEASQAELAVIEAQINDATAISPVSGIVLTKTVEAGEILAAGTTVATIGDMEHPWLRGYVQQKYQGRVKLGSPVAVTTDSFPDRIYDGRLSFLASEAEFTPKQIQTQEERIKLVYRIKIEIANSNQELKRNMPADAVIPLDEQASAPGKQAAAKLP